MQSHSDKTLDEPNKIIADVSPEKQTGIRTTTPLVDKRTVTIVQREQQKLMNQSPHLNLAIQMQSLANNYSARISHKKERTGDQTAKKQDQDKSANSQKSDLIQRNVKITFEEPEHEMDDFDPLTAKINYVDATRDKKNIAVEDTRPGAAQKAHTTSHVVFTNMLVRDLDQKTWVGAWQMLKEKYQFLQNLLARWYAANANQFRQASNASIRNDLPGLIQEGIDVCDGELTRGGHSITGTLYGALDKTDPDQTNWTYYDHLPDATDGVTSDTHKIKEWKLNLRSATVMRLETACEQWMHLRGYLPWTSVDEASYVTGDQAGPAAVEGAATGLAAQANISDGEALSMSKQIIKTFDFFPKSLKANRTYDHAAALAARHVVEHFQYHSSIKPAWHDQIAAQFLISWKAKIQAEKAAEEQKTRQALAGTAGKRTNAGAGVSGRDVAALHALLTAWNTDIKPKFGVYYTEFKNALV